MQRNPLILFAITLLIGVFFTPSVAHSADYYMQRPTITPTQLSAAELQGKGCEIVTITQIDTTKNVVKHTYSDSHDVRFLHADNKGTPQELKGTNSYFFSNYPITWWSNTFSCPKNVVDNIIAQAKALNGFSFLDDPVAWAISGFFDFIDLFVKWTLDLVGSNLILIIIQQGNFIQNDIVLQGWPFIQGFANLGFIFALLYIALATTLRLESISHSIQRLLPKLLIGALLVNFSLVIGGLVIDASRLVMAVELTFVGGKDVGNGQLISKILETSKIYENTSQSFFGSDPNTSGWTGHILTRLKTSILKFALSLGLFIIALNLFIRYIVLLILLIFSPFAYLAIAVPSPQAQKFFFQWWGMFIKWVAYGPIVLFFLILITKINSIGLPPEAGVFAHVAQFCVVIALLFAGHAVAKKAAGMGSSAVMGFAKKNPRAAIIAGASLASGGLLGGVAAAALTSRAAKNNIYRPVRDFANTAVVKPFNKRFKVGSEGIYDEKGKLKEGKTSYGSKTGSAIQSFVKGDVREQNSVIKNETDKYNSLPDKNSFEPSNEFIGNLPKSSFVAKLDDTMLSGLLKSDKSGVAVKAMSAAIAKNQNNAITNDQINKIITAIEDDDANQNNKEVLIKGMSQNVSLIQNLKGEQVAKLLKNADTKGTENILKALATKDKK